MAVGFEAKAKAKNFGLKAEARAMPNNKYT